MTKRYFDRDDCGVYFLTDRRNATMSADLSLGDAIWVARVEAEFDEVQNFLDGKVKEMKR